MGRRSKGKGAFGCIGMWEGGVCDVGRFGESEGWRDEGCVVRGAREGLVLADCGRRESALKIQRMSFSAFDDGAIWYYFIM